MKNTKWFLLFAIAVLTLTGCDNNKKDEQGQQNPSSTHATNSEDSYQAAMTAYQSGEFEKAFTLLQPLAQQGKAEAQHQLGVMYIKGVYVAQDNQEARAWFEKAAMQGYDTSQASLGMIYAQGIGVGQDYIKAREWFEKAAAQGDAIAENGLGWLYGNGNGVAQDYAEAREWFEKAAALGMQMHSLVWKEYMRKVLA